MRLAESEHANMHVCNEDAKGVFDMRTHVHDIDVLFGDVALLLW